MKGRISAAAARAKRLGQTAMTKARGAVQRVKPLKRCTNEELECRYYRLLDGTPWSKIEHRATRRVMERIYRVKEEMAKRKIIPNVYWNVWEENILFSNLKKT